MNLETKVAALPHAPGVYLMKDAGGRVLYVGKAGDLKKRVGSYFSKRAEGRYQIKFLMQKVRDLESIVTTSEKEALLLENTLIKKHSPKYNLQLKDDRSYLSLKLSVKDRFPRLYITRQIRKDGSLYFGPYPSGSACRETVEFIEKHFRLRTCSDHEFANRSRPCLQYQIHRCDAPCVGQIGRNDYGKIAGQVRLFLEGHNQDLLREVRQEMALLAGREEFEKAARCRNLIRAIETTLEKQSVARHLWLDQDVIAWHREGERVTVCLLEIRQGKVWESRLYHLASYQEDAELLDQFLNQYYEDRRIPDEIVLAAKPESPVELRQILRDRRGGAVRLSIHPRGDRRDLLRLAFRNAADGFKRRQGREEELREILARLQNSLGLQNLPRRIECFDISNLGGKQAVGSLVCFVEGEPLKEGYRRFRIRGKQEPDDYRMMQEVLSRRLLHKETAKWIRPDLIVIDGGRGQLQVACRVIEQLNVTGIDVIALAKAKEGEAVDKVYLPGRKNPVRFRPHSSLLHLLMRIRDEAHRFAIAYHKKIRQQEFLP